MNSRKAWSKVLSRCYRNSRKFSISYLTLGLNFLLCKIQELDQIRSDLTLKVLIYNLHSLHFPSGNSEAHIQ